MSNFDNLDYDDEEFAYKVISLLPLQWVHSFKAYKALEFYWVDDYIYMIYNQIDKVNLEKIMKLCIENVDPRMNCVNDDEYIGDTPYEVLRAIKEQKNTMEKGKFNGEMYYLTRSEKCKDPEYILTMFCDEPTKTIQKVWRRYREIKRNKAAKIIQNAVLKWLYRPDGNIMKKAEARFHALV